MKTTNKYISTFFSILLGSVYVLSGVTKGMDIGSFINLLLLYGNEWFGYFAPFITGFEIFLGFGFIFGTSKKLLAQISFFFIIFLTVIYLIGFFFLGIIDCGCFGKFLHLSPLTTIIKNSLLIGLSFWLWKLSSPQLSKKWVLVFPIVFGLITFAVNFIEFKRRINNDLSLKEVDLNKTFIKNYAINENQFIYFFNPNCEPCRKAGIRLNESTTNVKGFYSNSFKEVEINNYIKIVKPNFKIYSIPQDSMKKYITIVPTILEIKNGKIQKVSH